jgi:hypothetical protein
VTVRRISENEGSNAMIYVFVWPGILQGNVGHTSLRIDGTPSHGEEYISWWPAGAGSVVEFLTDQGIPATTHTFAQDEEAEGYANFHHIGIFGMDEDAMRSWWAKFKADPTYRLFHRSCATTVAKVLAAGNHDSLTLDDNSVWTPFGVWAYAQRIYWTRKLLAG